MLTVEFHAHSEHSHDGRDTVEALLEQARDVGLDGLAVTDHDTIDGSLDAAEKAADYGLVGIPGMEVTSEAGHVLALGVSDLIPADLSFAETLDRIHDAGGIAIVPHPFQKSRHGVGPHVDRETLASADAIEVYNSRLLTGLANRRAEQFARQHGLPMTAGSDAHISEMVGRAPTQVGTDERSVEAILDAVVAGRTSFEGERTPWRVSFRQAAGGAKRRIKRRLGDFFE
ncbi:MAG: PHP domain-containing protein [Halobacteriaceae archaeon]